MPILPITFISYSRKQLYFAESLALHLQKEGVEVWFDLQKLQAGTVWSDGLEKAAGEAGKMVLVVSKASLESAYTQAEWQGFTRPGHQLVLAIYEPVELPDLARGLPTYDFRGGFEGRLLDLAAFLRGQAEPRHDPVASPNRFHISLRLPGVIWLTLCAQFGCFIACVLGLLITIYYRGLESATPNQFYLYVAVLSLAVGARYAIPFLRHTLDYQKLKRSTLINLLLFIPVSLAVAYLGQATRVGDVASDSAGGSYVYRAMLAGTALLTLFAHVYLFRHSASLLRWMRPEEKLQRLRRRAHQPLVAKATFDVDAAAHSEGVAITYAIHTDPADEPVARWIEGTFQQAGHTRVAPDQNPGHHIAILSNRSSAAWVQELTRSHAGQLAFVVVSTIEFSDTLTETGRYQWVDARDGDRLDIIGLARSLAAVDAWKREAALETNPAMIDRWKVPAGITVLKRAMELFAIYVLVFGLTDLVGFVMQLLISIPQNPGSSPARSTVLVALGAGCLWIASKALIYRKVPAPVLYGCFVGATVLVGLMGTMVRLHDAGAGLRSQWWYEPALTLGIVLPVVMYSMLSSRFWLPAFARANPDEVGIKQSIDRGFKRNIVITIMVWVMVIVGIAVGIYVKWMRPG